MSRRKKSSLLCIPDTNSLIHMRDIDVANKKLWLWLWEEFDVQLSEAICNELHDHPDLNDTGMENKCKKSVWSFRGQESKLKKLEEAFVQHFDIKLNGNENQGECHNCCVALDAILSGRYRQVIFLTNELKTTDPKRDGSLFRVFNNFRIGEIWSSLDFVLYLFARHRNRFHSQIAEAALKDINGRIGGKTKNDVPAKRLRCYNSKLKKINETLSQLPPYANIRS
ncbi:hypothetical protein F4X10_11480 [Candidatus Poribacteria bacterium]|nr:hypothetical protein [Candidatus Poribacteria bacterium]